MNKKDGYEEQSNEILSHEEREQHEKDLQDLTEAASALFRIPVFFSHQNLFSLDTTRQRFIVRMFNEIKKVLLFPRTLPNTDEYPDTTLENIRTMVNSSYGLVAALLVPTGPTSPQGEPYSPFLQIEPAMGYQYGLPLFLVAERAMLDRAGGIWSGQTAPFTPIVWFSNTVTVEQFFNSVPWKEALQNWAGQVRSGYFAQTGPEFEYKFNSHD
ncbi:hypothetical protein [Paenibacillus taiwanensis]|uniref:hypothetical protein n=1 Tax=Paenibacillus taiwanensis TaxID=401638 RepID=UPI000423A874|nr:hypothetical protein [Paenibacillus taiwanensis]